MVLARAATSWRSAPLPTGSTEERRAMGKLSVDTDLIEALALLHDIGHPPFGHAGEQVLDRCLAKEGGGLHSRPKSVPREKYC